MKYYIIAGEASGDLHGSNMMKQIVRLDPDAEFRFWGGDLMAETGGQPVKHYRELAFMGFVEVLKNIRTIKANFGLCKEDMTSFSPDALILIDYPGFNLRIAKWASEKGFRVFYYISPQVWAWKESRVRDIKKYVEKMFVILPFEKEFYKKHEYNVQFVGHPLIEVIEEYRSKHDATGDFSSRYKLSGKPVVALLPGSRKQEIRAKLPLMLKMKEYFTDCEFVLAGAPSQEEGFYREVAGDPNLKVYFNETYDILSIANAALVTSGTATLEAGLFSVPQVVCYRSMGRISYWIAKKLVKVKYISLVNLIMDQLVVKELIQDDLNEENLRMELDRILNDKAFREEQLTGYSRLYNLLGDKRASENVAAEIYNTMKNG